jgi:hypothetical protein
MPCRDDQWEYQKDKENRERSDMIARIACKVLEAYEKQGFSAGMLLDTKEHNWWLAHKKADEARIQKEQESERIEKIRRNALSKLTLEERKALNFGL